MTPSLHNTTFPLLQLILHVGKGRSLIHIVLNITEFNWLLWNVFWLNGTEYNAQESLFLSVWWFSQKSTVFSFFLLSALPHTIELLCFAGADNLKGIAHNAWDINASLSCPFCAKCIADGSRQLLHCPSHFKDESLMMVALFLPHCGGEEPFGELWGEGVE